MTHEALILQLARRSERRRQEASRYAKMGDEEGGRWDHLGENWYHFAGKCYGHAMDDHSLAEELLCMRRRRA
jgi:hypothetical protein